MHTENREPCSTQPETGCGTGCGTGCKNSCGKQKDQQREFVKTWLSRLYPHRSVLCDEAAFASGVSHPMCVRLAQQLAETTAAPTYLVSPSDTDLSRSIYVLCKGAPPPLLQFAETQVLPTFPTGPLREQHLRVRLSSLAPAACVHEVTFELFPVEHTHALSILREVPSPGVFDPQLLPRLQKIHDLLSAFGLCVLHADLLDSPANSIFPDQAITHGETQETPPTDTERKWVAELLFSQSPLFAHREIHFRPSP